MDYLAKRLSAFDSSEFLTAAKYRATLVDPIDLSIGIPEELTPKKIKAAGIRAIKANQTTYLPANGLPELRAAIAKHLLNDNAIPCTANSVTIVPGLTTGLLLVYLTVLDPGDEIIMLDPYYPPYPQLAELIGAKPVIVPTLHNFQPDLAAIKAAITTKTKAILVNSPNNPSGAVYPEETLRQIADIAREHKLLVLSDEIYEDFSYSVPHFSVGSIYEPTITMSGFSKGFAMTGWRLGYVAGPQELIDGMNELLQYAVMSSSSIAQYAALASFTRPPRLLNSYRKKRDLVVRRLTGMGLDVQAADGAFYVFVKTPPGMSDLEFVEQAAKHGVILVAGRAFSRSQSHFRISYGVSLKTLERGMKALSSMLQ